MGAAETKYFVGDFETTVYKGQTYTEVWSAACAELYTDNVLVFHSIGEQFEYFRKMPNNIVCYYHNLKFDGAFWLSYLLVNLGYAQAYERTDFKDGTFDIVFNSKKNMPNNSVIYSISNMGQWYRIIVKTHGKYIEFRDSLKLLPFSVKRIGESFGTKHKKLDMEYTGYRYAGCPISDKEMEYIKNDVLVMKEAMEIMFDEGHTKLTIGSCCLSEYKKTIGNQVYDEDYPDMYKIELDKDKYGAENAGRYIKRAYHGGWCYLVRGKENRLYHNGTTADVNSLYPSMMSSESGNKYPLGKPSFWSGNYIPDDVNKYGYYYFVRFKTRFYLKRGKLPFVQIKNSYLYKSTEMLETSDVYNHKDGKYYDYYIDKHGAKVPAIVTMTMTGPDYKLFLEHYNVVEFEILDGCYFCCREGIFDEYINKYKKIKLESKGAKRELAKLFLNNLYGKMAASPTSNFKVAFVKEDGTLGYMGIEANDKTPGYIPIGAAITSYARNFTIRAAQANYHGKNERGFIYADTDSIHCDLEPDEIVGIREHPKDFCCWKLESCWDVGWFVRQKTYVEHVTKEDREPIEKPFYNVKCAGMPEKCKNLFIKSMAGEQDENASEDEKKFLETKRTIEDFTIGLKIPGKLLPKRIPGGVVLMDTTFEMR